MLSDMGRTPTVDHLMSVQQAAQMMAEMHVEAIPVTKDDKVVGMFTERDYFDKVLNSKHPQAAEASMVCEVAATGQELVIARPDDTVESCLEVMMKKKLMALPVVELDGHVMGTISVMDLTKQYMEGMANEHMDALVGERFTEPSYFPDNFVSVDGGVHDEDLADSEALTSFTLAPMDEPLNADLEEVAASNFSESSVFPEFTPPEEVLLTQAHEEMMAAGPPPLDEREERVIMAHSALLDELSQFSQPSDFPEAAPVDEVVHARTG
ncbi:hypothetical protein Poli38472_008439 [Pythium oligandrum]|uniref:CBS domain-containing protein n=1 Tax=Pythium oligandrum TaxID=41045 RepID=A0A8K1CLP3_PYTOL|nr:hypothetical protein Poli38472_008439 [Pythium oligandrum]|eukprot:TMW65797.1 hypothetical protein Poli38472_008439 [Pythium oligandrum]